MPGTEYPGSTYPAQYAPDAAPLASGWYPVYPDTVPRAHPRHGVRLFAWIGTSAFPVPALAWAPGFPDLVPHRRTIYAPTHTPRPSSFPLPLPDPCTLTPPIAAGGPVCVLPEE
jgi:hypothetical protein